MSCPTNANIGFVTLSNGPIKQLDLNNIIVKAPPLSIALATTTIRPVLRGNIIEDSTATSSTCSYKGTTYHLVNIQICAVMNIGYTLPGQKNSPVAELIMTFRSPEGNNLSGILLCVPIYDSGTVSHAAYLSQVIDTDIPSCKYTKTPNIQYSDTPYRVFNTGSMTKCIIEACNDRNALAYNYIKNQSKCILYDSNPIKRIKKNDKEVNVFFGTVDHNVSNKTCNIKTNSTDKSVSNLESIFYSWEGDTTHTSIAYKTCFETISEDDEIHSKSLYVVVFPNGIHLPPSHFQQLVLQLNGTLLPYMVPPDISDGNATIQKYDIDDDNNTVPSIISDDGILNSKQVSTCTDSFKYRFEYFTLPPRSKRFMIKAPEKCPYYKTTQYKCVPFNQLKDLSGSYVVPGNKTLNDILKEENQTVESDDVQDTGKNEDMVANIMIVVALGLLAAGTYVIIKK